MRFARICAVLLAIWSMPILAEMHIVPDDFNIIMDAVREAEVGDTVLLRPGEYQEAVNFLGKDIILSSETLLDGNMEHKENTILTGLEFGSIVTFEYEETQNAALMNLTIRGGTAGYGGGIVIRNASPVIWNVVVDDCEAVSAGDGSGMGGGIYADGGSPLLMQITVRNCRAAYAAGIALRNCDADITELNLFDNHSIGLDQSPARAGALMLMNGAFRLTDSNIYNNIANGGGAGLYTAMAELNVENCLFYGNNADNERSGSGGAMSLNNGTNARFYRCQITDNQATLHGAAFAMRSTSLFLVNCTIANNSAVSSGAIYQMLNCYTISVNSIFWGNGANQVTFLEGGNTFVAANSDIQGGERSILAGGFGNVLWQDGNIDSDPLFVNADEGDFYLSDESPCIDGGVQRFEWNDVVIANIPRNEITGELPDMGCYENENVIVKPVNPYLPVKSAIISASPNPFNAIAAISVEVPFSGEVSIDIFDTQGRHLINLSNNRLNMGSYQFTWDASSYSAGVYLAILSSNGQVASTKLVLIK